MTITSTDLRVQADSYRQTMTTLIPQGMIDRYAGWATELEQRADRWDAEAKAERKLAAKAARAAAKLASVEQDEPAGLWT